MKCALIGNAKADAERYVPMRCARGARRVFYREMVGDEQVTHTLFLYNGYLCIQQLFSNEPWNVYKEFIWDPTEPIATRPLCFRQNGQQATFLLHDGNKNVTDVVTVGPHNSPVAHYEYAPFGAATHTGPRALDNPFRFSSEFADDTLGLVYYNYRHYNPADGRWTGRDAIYELGSINLYSRGDPLLFDSLGLDTVQAYNTYVDVYSVKRSHCLNVNGCYRWVVEDLPNLQLEYMQVVEAELVWSSREKWRAFLKACGKEFLPSLDEFVKGQLTDSTMSLLSQKVSGIELGMTFMEVLDIFQGIYNVTIETFVPPSGSQDLLQNGDYYKIVKTTPIARPTPLGFDSITSHLPAEPCTEKNEGKIYLTAKLLEIKLKELGGWRE